MRSGLYLVHGCLFKYGKPSFDSLWEPPRTHFGRLVKLQRMQWQHTQVLLPGKSNGQRSLVGCSPCSHEDSDSTEPLHFHFHFSLSCIGEGNGNPLQCSCQENPRDGRTWWAAVYAVAQSWTRLKWLSSRSSNSQTTRLNLSTRTK